MIDSLLIVMINDFIASEDALNGEDSKEDRFGKYITLKIDNSCLMRHTTTERAQKMNCDLEIVSFKISKQASMNGNPTTILSYILRV